MVGKIYGKGKFWVWSREVDSESGDNDDDDDVEGIQWITD